MKRRERRVTLKTLSDQITRQMGDLARITNRSFQAVENRIDILQKSLEDRVDNVEKAIMAVHGITDAIFAEIKLVRGEIETVDTREECADLDERVSVLEKKIGIRK